MTQIWNEEIERLKQDPDASVFLVSFASQNEAKSTIHKLSFARQITKDGKTGLALPGHINFKVGKSDDGSLWVLLAGRMSTEESLEAYQLFGLHGNEQMIVVPSQVENAITGTAATPTEPASAPQPVEVTPTPRLADVKAIPEPDKRLSAREPIVAEPTLEPAKLETTPIVATPTQTPVVVASPQSPVTETKAPVSTVAAPVQEPVKFTPATTSSVVKPAPTSTEIKPAPVVVSVAKEPAKVVSVHEPAKVVAVPEPARVSSVPQPVLAKPAQEPAVVKVTPAPTAIKAPPVVVKAAPEPVSVAPVQEPAKIVSAPAPAKVTPSLVTAGAQAPKEEKRIAPAVAQPTGDPSVTRIHLARQGKREGPYTLGHIKAQIAAGRYKDDDFWAWHEGLPEWIPLYKIPGVAQLSSAKS
ncbi:MAG: DUF4339 domain-containing protein [Verrucomicrobia bacterium]|nr:DUF4339 domain-containing protein [Verrucomicrobiota bacterium]